MSLNDLRLIELLKNHIEAENRAGKFEKYLETQKGHHQWVMNGYPDDPIVELNLETGVILFEDGTSLTASQHLMTDEALISLADLLK